ncbi:isochorismate synthase [Flavobacterium rhizosphaerae]|uniref:isochorismate synthase n=1 Tax=Flavobacterium rhizosphaerae TaxID=3163298 RepID=A0ABW8YTL1_9FLAO
MADILSKLSEQLKSQKPFAVYAKPGSTTLIGVFQDDDSENTVKDFSEAGFVFAPFQNGKIVHIPYKNSQVHVNDLEVKTVGISHLGLPPVNENAKADFEALVIKSVAEIKKDNFQKLVTSRTEFVEARKSITEIFSTLLQLYPNAFRYCFYSPSTGLWMGATPEQLLQTEGDTLKTVALAGTQVYDAEKEAVWGEKEKQEQQFVTDYIVSILKNVTRNSNISAPYTFRAGNIVHLKTDISASFGNTTLQNIIMALHPTPAVCGLPKYEARDFIVHNEGYNREYYSGFLGELNHDFKTGHPTTDLFVNLRSMKLWEGRAQLFIGCGITKDSDPEKEFFETVNKSMTMRRVL